MRLLTPLPQDDLHDARAAAVAAEAAGYDGVVTMENRNEPFLALGVAAVATARVELHTGIAIAFARSPMAVANVGLGPASGLARALRARPGLADPRPQREPLQRAVERRRRRGCASTSRHCARSGARGRPATSWTTVASTTTSR